jgi:hypothetical protein
MKPATAKAKGAKTEQLWVDFLKANGWPHAERRHLAGVADRGDIAGCPGVTVEVKSGARIDLATWMNELENEMNNDNTDVGYVAVRPKGRPNAGDWWCVVPAPVLVRLLKEAGW